MINNNYNDNDGNEDAIPIEVSAALELSEPAVDPTPEPKRGLASLRGVRRAVYMRRSLLRVLAMAPEERAAFEPRNGFEELAKALVDSRGKDGATVIALWREIRSSLGERTEGPNGRTRAENHYNIIADLPSPSRA
jgi:hypothetical protein